jgi:hypothetical protein
MQSCCEEFGCRWRVILPPKVASRLGAPYTRDLAKRPKTFAAPQHGRAAPTSPIRAKLGGGHENRAPATTLCHGPRLAARSEVAIDFGKPRSSDGEGQCLNLLQGRGEEGFPPSVV